MQKIIRAECSAIVGFRSFPVEVYFPVIIVDQFYIPVARTVVFWTFGKLVKGQSNLLSRGSRSDDIAACGRTFASAVAELLYRLANLLGSVGGVTLRNGFSRDSIERVYQADTA